MDPAPSVPVPQDLAFSDPARCTHATRSTQQPPELGFEQLFTGEYAPMVRVAYLITRSQSVAEEIVNEAFLTLLKRWSTLTAPGGYLRTTVVRAAIRSRRRATRERELLARQRTHEPTGDPVLDQMWDALATLPVKQRAALVLRFYADCSHEQIAAALHCPEATARSLVHRGLATLRKDLHRWT